MLFICYPRCSTCAKARKWLQQNNIDFTERDIKIDNPSTAELRDWQVKSGLPLKRFFNTSGIQYRELQLKDKLPTMTDDQAFDLLATDGMLVKRPILVDDNNNVLVGFKQDQWQQTLLD
jgi:arsenate reductase